MKPTLTSHIHTLCLVRRSWASDVVYLAPEVLYWPKKICRHSSSWAFWDVSPGFPDDKPLPGHSSYVPRSPLLRTTGHQHRFRHLLHPWPTTTGTLSSRGAFPEAQEFTRVREEPKTSQKKNSNQITLFNYAAEVTSKMHPHHSTN